MKVETATGIGMVIALLVTIFITAYVLPAGKEGQFTGFLKTIRDYFLMRYLIVEAIVRFFFVLATTSCIFSGFFLIFAKQRYGGGFVSGLLTMIVGPIICRIVYELLMIAILQLRNIIEINNKLPGTGAPVAPVQPVQQAAAPVQPIAPAAPVQPVQQPVTPVAPVQPAQPEVRPGAKFDPVTGMPIEQPQDTQNSEQ